MFPGAPHIIYDVHLEKYLKKNFNGYFYIYFLEYVLFLLIACYQPNFIRVPDKMLEYILSGALC